MSVLNAIKVMFSNFRNMWKLLVFRLIAMTITLSIVLALALPTITYIFQKIADTGLWANLWKFIGGLFSGSFEIGNFGELFKDNLIEVGNILLMNVDRLVLTYIYILLAMCLSRFLNCVADYALCDVVSAKMTAYAKVSFVGSIFSNLGKAVRFALAKVMFTIPLDALILLLAIVMFIFLFYPLGVLMPILLILTVLVLIAFRMTLFSAWLPYVVTEGDTIFGGLKRGVKTAFRNFWSIYSSWIILELFLLAFGVVFIIFTYGIGAFIFFPTVFLLFVCYYSVLYANAEGKRYYIDHETIITPKALYDKQQFGGVKVNEKVLYDTSSQGETAEETEEK